MSEKRRAISRLLALAVILATAFIRGSVSLPDWAGGRSLLLLPAVTALAFFESALPATLFGLGAGALWDLSSAGPDGLFTLYLGLAALSASLLAERFLRRKVTSVLAVCAAFIVVATALLTIVSPGAAQDRSFAMLTFRLPAALIAEISVFLYFYGMKAIYADKTYGVIALTDADR